MIILRSACAASIVRLYYSVVSYHHKDFTYLAGIQGLWAIAELTCGILAMCLPMSPKFFRSLQDSKMWSGFRLSLHSITRSKTQLIQTPNTRHDVAGPTNQRSSSHSLKATFREYNFSPHDIELKSTSSEATGQRTTIRHEIELKSTSSDASSDRNTQGDHRTRIYPTSSSHGRLFTSV